jgi:hypothetical protein
MESIFGQFFSKQSMASRERQRPEQDRQRPESLKAMRDAVRVSMVRLHDK